MSDVEKQGELPVEGEPEPTELEALQARVDEAESHKAALWWVVVGLALNTLALQYFEAPWYLALALVLGLAAIYLIATGWRGLRLLPPTWLKRLAAPQDDEDYTFGLKLSAGVGLTFLLVSLFIFLGGGQDVREMLLGEHDRGLPWTAIIALTAAPTALLTLHWRTKHKNQDLKHQQANHERDESRILNERYAKAVELLGAEKLSTRLGAIYALEQLAADSAKHHWTVMETLCAFIRNAPRPEGVETSVEEAPTDRDDDDTNKPQSKPTADVQAALDVIGRRSEEGREEEEVEGRRLDLTAAHLEGAVLRGVHLESAVLIEAHLEGAILWGAHLERANLSSAHLERAILWGAHLEGASLWGAHLERANLGSAHLEGANLGSAHLEGAVLVGAHLEGADLSSAHLERAVLIGAHLEGADLSSAHLERADLSSAHLERAIRYKDDTLTPAGWAIKRHPEHDDFILLTKAPTDEEP